MRDVEIAAQSERLGIIETQLDAGSVVGQGGIVLAEGEVGRRASRCICRGIACPKFHGVSVISNRRVRAF